MQIRKKHVAVHADFRASGEVISTGIAFEDYTRMSTQQYKLNMGRHEDAPEWVFNDSKLRDVLVRSMEGRAYSGTKQYPKHGTPAERLGRAQKMLTDRRQAELTAVIRKLCAAYMAAKEAGDTARAKALEPKIEETDTQLLMVKDASRIIAGVAYHYWRCGLNSVQTAHALRIKPPHVRGILWRLKKVAGELGYGPRTAIKHRPGTLAYRRAMKRAERTVKRAAKARELGKQPAKMEVLRKAAYLTLTRTNDPALHCRAAQTLVRHFAATA